MTILPTIEDVAAAAKRLAGLSVVTPLIEHPALNERAGGRVLLKAENLQRVGAFKFRGAYNAIAQIDRTVHPGGVVACSSGNHAQGVAAAAALCALPAAVVMPSDAPALKRARTEAYGAEVVTYDRANEDRDAIAHALAAERRAAFVHPFDNPHVIAGQGTAGLELMRQAHAVGAVLDAVLVCCAGGGLLSGVALAVKAANSATDVHPVEPAGFDDFARSLVAGERQKNTQRTGTICDALLVETPGELTFAIAERNCAPGLVVSDDEARAAMRFAFHELKLVLEPGGAVALAAVLSGKYPVAGKTVCCLLSGGNVDPALYAATIADHSPRSVQ